MNKRLFLISVPMVLVPYLALFTLFTIFFSTKVPFFRWVMESVFRGNALYLIAAMLLYCALTVTVSVICFFISINKNWDALSLAKFAMIVKLAQIPAYLCILAMPLFYSISEGICLGVISYVVIKIACGKAKDVTPLMYVLAVLFVLKYIFL